MKLRALLAIPIAGGRVSDVVEGFGDGADVLSSGSGYKYAG